MITSNIIPTHAQGCEVLGVMKTEDIPGISDLNDVNYMDYGVARDANNQPTTGWFQVLTFSITNGYFRIQIATSTANTKDTYYIRKYSGGSGGGWTSWHEIQMT